MSSPHQTEAGATPSSVKHLSDRLRDNTVGDPSIRSALEDEYYPAALRVLPKAVRGDLLAVYAVARSIDYLGDVAPGDRVGALHEFRADLHRIWRGDIPRRSVLQAMVPTVWAHGLSVEPFDQLIEASLLDQKVSRYATCDELIGYCHLAADPVGRLVLDIFGQGSPDVTELSDRVCQAMQLFDCWLDVAEDRRAGRVYLPQEDLAAHGVPETDLDRPCASDALRSLMLFETDRAALLLESGAPLLGRLTGWAKVAVAGYIAGGRAAERALRRTGGDVLGRATNTRRRDVVFTIANLLLRAPHRRIER